MGKRKDTKQPVPELAIESSPIETVVEDVKTTRYVVLRDGYRVSDKEYEIPSDPICVAEADFWTRVATNHSYGEKVEIVVYDSKKHRIW